MSCFWGHKWSKWNPYRYEGERMFVGLLAPKEVRGKWFDVSENRQKRQCVKCGKNEDTKV